MRITKYQWHNLVRCLLCFWPFWAMLAGCCPLSWLLIWLWSAVMDPSVVLCYISMQKVRSKSPKQLQTVFIPNEGKCSTHFSWINVYAKWRWHVTLISLRCQLSSVTSVYGVSKLFCGFCWVVRHRRCFYDRV